MCSVGQIQDGSTLIKGERGGGGEGGGGGLETESFEAKCEVYQGDADIRRSVSTALQLIVAPFHSQVQKVHLPNLLTRNVYLR